MMRITAYVSGRVQRVGYRARVIQIANGMGLKGIIENLSDGRVRILAEGEENKLKLFEGVIDIKNTLIKVSSIETNYSNATGDFSSFYKLVGTGETDSRLDEGIIVLKDMRELLVSIRDKQDETISEIKYTNKNLGDKMDQMLDKQDETVIEIRDMNGNLGDKMDESLERIDIAELKGDVADIKSALRAKEII